MPTFQSPTYSKVMNPKSGNAESCYTFIVENNEAEEKLSIVAEEPVTLLTLEKTLEGNTEWWNKWVSSFLEASAKHFSKPYTVHHIHKITKHQLNHTEHHVFPANVTFYPQTIRIHGGAFLVEWCYQITPVTIEIPDLTEEEETLPVSHLSDDVQEVDLEEVPVDLNATEESLILHTPTKFYEKNKVKEARLKAKIAMYRAQHQMNKYYEKYGTEVTDSDTDEEESSEEDEEVQL
jgi:hypothetical protein